MDKVYEKAYEKVIDYIESNILDGHFEVGDKLPSERELSQMLSVSRNSVREGIRILEVIGVISSLFVADWAVRPSALPVSTASAITLQIILIRPLFR